MHSLLVISNEPALAETLASELGELTVTGVRAKEADSHLHKGNYDLVIIDSDVTALPDVRADFIRLARPIILENAIYTILQRLKSKTAVSKEEIILAPNSVFFPADRLIRTTDNTSNIPLTEKEVKLLQHLTQHQHEMLSRESLLKDVWGYSEDINTHTLETHIYRLRHKLKQVNPSLDILFSEEGGYTLKNK